MSRNKDVKKLHLLSGRSYKECREIYKSSHWDFNVAVLILCPDIFDVFADAVEKVVDALSVWRNTIVKAFSNFVEEAGIILHEQFGEIDVSNIPSGHTDQPEDEEEQSADCISEW